MTTLKEAKVNDRFRIAYLSDKFILIKINYIDNDMTIRNERTGDISVYSPNTPIIID